MNDRLTFEDTNVSDLPARVVHWWGAEIMQIVETDTHAHGVSVIVHNIMREARLRR